MILLKIHKKILFFKYIKKVEVKFGEATIKNVLDFFEKLEDTNFKLVEWVLEFIIENSNKKIDDYDKAQIVYYHDSLWEKIKENYFKGVFSNKKASGKKEDTPIESLLVFASKEAGINGYDLLHKMTFRELKLFVDGAVWNLNEQSKKGKRLNRMKLLRDKAEKRTEDEKEIIKKRFEYLRNFKPVKQ